MQVYYKVPDVHPLDDDIRSVVGTHTQKDVPKTKSLFLRSFFYKDLIYVPGEFNEWTFVGPIEIDMWLKTYNRYFSAHPGITFTDACRYKQMDSDMYRFWKMVKEKFGKTGVWLYYPL